MLASRSFAILASTHLFHRRCSFTYCSATYNRMHVGGAVLITENGSENELGRKKCWITTYNGGRHSKGPWRALKCHGFTQCANKDEIENSLL